MCSNGRSTAASIVVGDLVHRVRAEHEEVGARRPRATGAAATSSRGRVVPAALDLHPLDLGEVDGVAARSARSAARRGGRAPSRWPGGSTPRWTPSSSRRGTRSAACFSCRRSSPGLATSLSTRLSTRPSVPSSGRADRRAPSSARNGRSGSSQSTWSSSSGPSQRTASCSTGSGVAVDRHHGHPQPVGVADRRGPVEPPGDQCPDAELLVQLADQRLLRRLPRLDLAARELPAARGLGGRRTPAREDAPVADHGGADDEQHGREASVAGCRSSSSRVSTCSARTRPSTRSTRWPTGSAAGWASTACSATCSAGCGAPWRPGSGSAGRCAGRCATPGTSGGGHRA